MAGGTKGSVAAAALVLTPVIEQTIKIEKEIAELAAQAAGNRAFILQQMQANELTRFATTDGSEALVVEKEKFKWNLERLRNVLESKDFAKYCPATPAAKKLRKLLEAAEAPKGLRGCAKVTKAKEIKLGSPGAAPETEKAEEEEDVA